MLPIVDRKLCCSVAGMWKQGTHREFLRAKLEKTSWKTDQEVNFSVIDV
jgi:hypothetical protein